MQEDTLKTFWVHTEELTKLLKVVIRTIVFFSVAVLVLPANIDFFKDPFKNYEPIIPVLLKSIKAHFLGDVELIGLKFTGPMEIYLLASVFFGFIFSIPIIVYQLYKFINPALQPEERKEMYSFIIGGLIFFSIGAVFAFTLLLPTVIRSMFPFFIAVGAETVISLTSFYSLVLSTTFLSGLIFTFPLLFILLVKYGIIGTESIRNNRIYVYGILLISTIIISPGGSPQENILLFVPMIILLEVGLFFGRRYENVGKVQQRKWFWQRENCKFCDEKIPNNSKVCPKCEKSQV